ncbi:bifunctional protein-serine/threonine kinase/phosphatase [Hydrogenophaga sp. PBL-H3]|uniref:bifunctional protein-serine/threonine kinase/phosphatase n=1 Tax=Hydrogenophaga sp. PBL-H3 TaxID=434010 RepID=UPI0013203F49|nr:bifunctional protein-serine/threonine kinase/phosphatase [Hydrogenophaga sp. PBL-H3]QHE76011.1 bifunctional protein-serine/threonine kinase/phosphatase [Hydrogenophaga sp. PBL-H3]QHE80435.1 bifunctional protein-serine/threonine kinase/phosphatase [Hydrogenophaga sp. PBL-H3]
MAFDIDIGFVCKAGRKEPNEDFCAAMLPPEGQEDMGSIVAIADGVSAGGLGREAAQTTVTSLVRDYHSTPETWDTTVALDRIIGAQNAWLAGVNRSRQPAMGLTTLTALVLRGQSYTLAHVGDSRCYLLRDGQTLRLTHDHVVNHPDLQHQLLRAVGLEDHLVVDYVQGDLQVGDTFVMLTDGVHARLSERRLADCADPSTRAQDTCERLVEAALAAGSDDNLTAMVVRVLGLLDPNLEDASRAAQTLPMAPRLKVGDPIDGFVVTAPVADNGINLLYQVRDPATQALYALKTLHPARAHDHDERAMLAHEAWLSRRMQSSRAADNLVCLHHSLPTQRPRSAYYLLYDWHGGETLQQMLDRMQRFAPAQAVQIAMQTLRVLGRMHRQGVIHRDIKPANLHQGDDGVLRVLDLGVALSGREPESMRRLHAGTASYVNPEQWGYNTRQASGASDAESKELPDAQSDLFALGVTLYQLLTGRLPYGQVLPYQVGRYYRDPTPPSRHNPEVPIWLDHVVQKAVARDKALRFETAEEFLLALERGASRPLTMPPASALLQRDPTMLWKLLLGLSALFNVLLVYWLLFLPT